MSYQSSEAQHGAKPPKEIRTVQQDGDIIKEDYERLNPDGTVIKTITLTDSRTGQKQVSVYKMDKSGIVRKLEDAEHKKEDLLQQLRNQLAETRATVQSLKEQTDNQNSKSVAYENGYKNGKSYTKRVEEQVPDKHEMAYNLRNINTPIELSPKQQSMIREHKENIINYGTQKLIKQLNKKLNEDKFNDSYSLTDEQKDKVIEYGIKKLQRLLENSLDDEKLIYDVMSFNPDFGEVDLSGRGKKQFPGDQSVSFSLNPYKDIAPEDIAKPISFSMRPEQSSKPLPEPKNDGYQEEIHDGGKRSYEGEAKFKDYDKLLDSAKRLITDSELYKKSPLSSNEKEEVIDYALEQIKSTFKDSGELDEQKVSQKKKIDLSEFFEDDEIYDYGKKALKKLVRRSMKGFGLDHDIIHQKKIDDPDLSERREAFFQYLADIVDGRMKETDPLPIPLKIKKNKQKEEPEEKKWDYSSLLSSIFGQREKLKTEKPEEKPKEKQKKTPDLDSLLSWFQVDKEDKPDIEKESTQPTENIPKVKPRFYQLDPLPDSKNEQNKTESESKGFDLRSLLKKIQMAAVKQFSEPLQSENIENTNKESTPAQQENSQTKVNNNTNSLERELKPADLDLAMTRIKQNNNEASNSKRVTNKPAYFKERISGLDSIPRPIITSVSPPKRNLESSDQISFKLKPHNYDNTSKQEEKPRSLENQTIETGKSSSHEQDFQPWWFESPESFVKKTFEKPLIKDIIDTPAIHSSFSGGGNNFSTGGSFSPKNLIH